MGRGGGGLRVAPPCYGWNGGPNCTIGSKNKKGDRGAISSLAGELMLSLFFHHSVVLQKRATAHTAGKSHMLLVTLLNTRTVKRLDKVGAMCFLLLGTILRYTP
eukprot:GEMP01080804.1.p1 GENE.GEMP01080804.1~~GEMP01080804.1.p1  ORF type:complete len:104 (+),score=0.63 GEMP01080804.1:649-960(+)